MSELSKDMSLVSGPPSNLNSFQRVGLFLGWSGMIVLILASLNQISSSFGYFLTMSLGGISLGIISYAYGLYANHSEGIKNHQLWFNSIANRGVLAWLAGVSLTSFYIILYFYPELLGLREGNNVGLIALFDPLSKALSGNPASQWFVYGTLYTLAILAFGLKFIWKYRHNRYQKIRTASVMFFQTAFAFIIPELMARLNGDNLQLPYYDLKNVWPLNYYNFEQYRVDAFINSGNIGLVLLIFGVISILVITPLLTYFYGKRWYCSWVCGCGGLAETAGDSFRHLSDKSSKAWKIERWLIHLVLVFVVVMTTTVVATYLGYDETKYWLTKDSFLVLVGALILTVFTLIWIFKREELAKDARYGMIGTTVILLALFGIHLSSVSNQIFFIEAETLRSSYGFLIGSIFSGVIGTGFYPIMGNRVWCRFGCPMAAILGLQQRLFSRFRITTNGGQCISCGNCSTYCEMGIDVKAYAQRGQNIVRSSCVGCGICSAVCPRGVLKLENGKDTGASRYEDKPITFGNNGPKLNF